MIDVLSVENMRNSDAAAIAGGVPGAVLMERAGRAIFAAHRWRGPVAIVCGSGNNAGDGYVLAGLLREAGVECALVRLSEKLSPDGGIFYEKCRGAGVPELRLWEAGSASGIFRGFETVVDCIFGTGFKGAAGGLAAEVIKEINASGCEVVSVDINSGLSGDNGLIGGEYPAAEGAVCVESDLTVSVGGFKPGHFLGSAKDVMKRKINCDIGIAPVEPPYRLLTREDAASAIPRRMNLSNKGTYGYVTLIGGSARYSGAIRLACLAEAALRSGAGVATVAVPAGIAPLITSHVLESTILPLPETDGEIAFDPDALSRIAERSAVITFGMGVGTGEGAERSLSWLLENYSGRLIVDADGLTLLARLPEGALAGAKPAIVLTPHVKEFSRLLGGVPVSDIMGAPIALAQRYAARYLAVTLLLKGPTTVVTDGGRVYLTDAGCPGMATAGSGDVLSGVLTAMAACIPDLTLAAAVGAYVNGRAGEAAQRDLGPVSMLAGDTAARLPEVFMSLTADQCASERRNMIILASKSPRRRQLLELVGIEYKCIPSEVEEKVPAGMDLTRVPEYLSGLKAADVAASHPDDIVIGSDTLVEFDGKALGKPRDEQDAARMLRELSGRRHTVYTGVTIVSPLGRESFTSATEVEFYQLTDEDIRWYVSTGEPMDKAGAYGIQGYGAVLVKAIDGDYFTVMGLPVAEVARRVRRIETELASGRDKPGN